jgi:predicted aminopeptidase
MHRRGTGGSVKAPAVVLMSVLLGGCQIGYYAHLLGGQTELMQRRAPIAQLLADPGTDPELRHRLERVLDAREFAVRELALPDNRSYTLYADLERPYALWNVFAAPEFSLEPKTWCHPFTGCLAYRGYYDEDRARREAGRLAAAGWDVYVGGVTAYSTLGWFDDPVLNTMMVWPDDRLAALVFHELAHQRVFAKGDTAFSESYASFVERQGLRDYLQQWPEQLAAAQTRWQRQDRFVQLMLEGRRRLEALYLEALPEADLRRRKQEEFERLRQDYLQLKAEWGGDPGYDGWFEGGPNNARLLPFGLYHEWAPAFEALFDRCGKDWAAFHREARALAGLDPGARAQRLRALAGEP